MSRDSYGAQAQQIAADRVMRDKYFDPETCHLGQRVAYRDDDATDDQAWNDAEARLRERGMSLYDDGSGLLIVTGRLSIDDRVTAADDAGRIVDFRACDAGGCDAIVAWDSGVRTPAATADLTAGRS